MPTLLITSENLDALKSAARGAFPAIKSAHLTEALASGLGYRTHAALLATMKCASSTKPICVELSANRFKERLSDFGFRANHADALIEAVRSPKLPDRIWIAYQNGDLNTHRTWYYECRRRGIPFLFIEKRRTYARLNWDCITIDAAEEGHIRGKEGRDLGRTMFEIFQSVVHGAPGKPTYDASSFVGHIDRLLPELAYELADTFFLMLYNPTRAHEKAA